VPTLTSLALKYGALELVLQECIITVNQEKNIVKTPMEGRDGTIKEYISDGDYSITIEAAVNNYNPEAVIETQDDAILRTGDLFATPKNEYAESQSYPKEKLQEVVKLLQIKDGLIMQNDFLAIFGIKNAVVTNYGMVQETHSNRQSFQIQMLSDEPYEIKINNY
jgi:hypothetical protein